MRYKITRTRSPLHMDTDIEHDDSYQEESLAVS